MTSRICTLLDKHPVIPVVEIEKPEHGRPLAEALIAGGIHCIEVTLRTENALNAAERIVQIDDMLLGLGTVLEADQLRFAAEIGASFSVSPGISEDLVTTAQQEKMAYLPGTSTASEVMLARDLYCEVVKYFPAFIAPGVSSYQSIASVVPTMQFCLTGGISEANLAEVLQMKGVLSIGGTWIASRKAIADEDWSGITQRAKQAVAIAAGLTTQPDAAAA